MVGPREARNLDCTALGLVETEGVSAGWVERPVRRSQPNRCVLGLAAWLVFCVAGDWVLGQTRPAGQLDWITVRTVLVSPLLEELLFRGLLFNLLIRGGVAVGKASAVTAFGFVLIHLPGWSFMEGLSAESVTVGVSIGLLGLYLGLLVGRTGSVWPAYVVHAGNNAFSTGLLRALL